MADGHHKRRPDELSEEELAEASGEALPDREAMSVISADVTIPVDPAAAASVLAGDSEDEAHPAEPDDERAEEPEDEG